MRQSHGSTAGSDEIGWLARAEIQVAADMLMRQTLGDRDDSRSHEAFAASVRAADADLWVSIEPDGSIHE